MFHRWALWPENECSTYWGRVSWNTFDSKYFFPGCLESTLTLLHPTSFNMILGEETKQSFKPALGGKLLVIVHLVCMWYVFTNARIWIPYCLERSHVLFRAWLCWLVSATSYCWFLTDIYIFIILNLYLLFSLIYIYICMYVCMYIRLYKFSKYEILKLNKTCLKTMRLASCLVRG